MAGHHDGNGVRGASSRNSPNGLRLAEGARDFRVRARPAARNPLQLLPNAPLKRRRLQVQREFQSRLFAFDALLDLPHPALERIRGDAENTMTAELREEYPRAEIAPATDSFQRWVREIVQRIEGKQPRLELLLDLQATAFQRRVWQELQRIPRGRTRTYSEVARSLGQPKAVRAVARACATNPVSIVVPCHRVIREDGALAGYRWGLSRKQQLLEQERAARD